MIHTFPQANAFERLAYSLITLGAMGVLLAMAGIATQGLGLEFLPKLEEGNFWIRATMPESISLDYNCPLCPSSGHIATLTGAGATRLALAAVGTDTADPSRAALVRIENAAMASELLLTAVNRHRLGDLADQLDTGAGGTWFRRAESICAWPHCIPRSRGINTVPVREGITIAPMTS